MVIDTRKMAVQLSGICCMLLLAVSAAGGQPLFTSGIVVPLAGAPTAALPILVVADVGSVPGAADGCPDLITASADFPSGVTIAYGNKSGSLCTGSFSSAFVGPSLDGVPVSMVLANFDADSVKDLVVADTADTVVLLHGNAAIGGFDSPGPPISAGQGVTALALADVNHDSRNDLLVLNSATTGSGITILLGDGQGGFTPGTSVSLSQGVSALTVFNGDQAVAITNSSTGTLTVLQSDGSGGFTVAQTISQGFSDPIGVAADDLTSDGRPDLVVVNRGSDSVAVLNGTAGGTFQVPRLFSSGTASSLPNSVVLFDANQDSKVDVVVSNNFSTDVSVLLGDGSGNFSAPRSFVSDQEPQIVAATDVSSDGIPDLIALNKHTQGSTANAVVLLGQGDGTFRGVENVASDANPNAVAAADTDNQGVPDLIVTHPSGAAQSTSLVEVHRAIPGGGFAPPLELQSHGDAAAVGAGDFNADGRLDLAVVNRQTDDVSVFLGQRNGFSATPQQNAAVGQGASAVVVGDWNGDGRADLAVTRAMPSPTPGVVSILLAGSNGSLGAPVNLGVQDNPAAVDAGDFNKDGDLDLVVANSTSGTVSILLGTGNGTFQTATTLPTLLPNVVALSVGDLDDDGFDDIALAQAGNQMQVLVLYGSSQGSFSAGVPVKGVGTPSAIAARDFTGDQIPDLVVLNQVDNLVLGFASRGTSRGFLAAGSFTVGRLPVSVAAGDFDGDGRYDTAAADNFQAGTVSVLTNIRAEAVLRGDSNRDQRVSAADVLGVVRKLGENDALRAEQVGKNTSVNFQYAAGPGTDANGDGLINRQDILAIARRMFPQI